MKLTVSESAAALGLRHVRAWAVEGAHPLMEGSGLTAEQVKETCAAVAARDQDDSRFAGYARLLTALGYPAATPAGERAWTMVETRGWRSHGAVIDAVGLATLESGAGIGLHRLDPQEHGHVLDVARATGEQTMLPAFRKKRETIPAGDLVYGSVDDAGDFNPWAWLGKRDCDNAERQLAAGSRRAVIVALGHPDDDDDHTASIGATIAAVLAGLRPDISVWELERS